MRKVLAILALTAVAGCSLFEGGMRDPILVGRTLGTLSCTVALTERPEVRAPLASALFATQAVLTSDSPSLSAIAAALGAIEDQKVRTYAAGVVAVALALFPELPENADTALPKPVVDAVLASIAGCNTVLGATSTTSTSSTVPEPTTTSTTIPPPPPNP